jgi:hypothetical protein
MKFLPLDFANWRRLRSVPNLPRPWVCSLKHGWLFYTWGRKRSGDDRNERIETRTNYKPPRMLYRRFLNLAEKSDDQIRAFAEQYGPLLGPPYSGEKLSEWRNCIQIAVETREAGQRLELGIGKRHGAPLEVWELPRGRRNRPPVPLAKTTIAKGISNLLNLRNCTRIFVRWSGRVAELLICPTSLLGCVALQLFYSFAGQGEALMCSECGKRFRPKRLPSSGTRRYCSACRRGKIPQRDAMRDWRRRKRSV